MIKRKAAKTHGKLKLSQYFKELKDGDKVAIVREHSMEPKFPVRIQGKCGVVIGQKGAAYLVRINEGNAEKVHILKPIHLIRIK
ncbi:MAG: 50S ribosomal protein L21e [Nanoarchaeota archaeon]